MARHESCSLILMKMAFLMVILMGTLIAGFFFIKERLNEYFNRGETLEVPDFRGQHLVKVFKEKAGDLVLEKRDEKYDTRYPKDHVVAQYPEAGTRVRANKKVFLTISLGNKQVKVPDLVQRSLRETDLALLNAQLSHGNRVYIPSDRVPKERIVAQSPLPGDTHGVQDGVDLVISLGSSQRRVPLPSLLGKTVEEAKSSLSAWGLRLGRVLTKADPGRTKAEVLATDPPPYQPISEGATIDLLVSTDASSGNATAKDLRLFEFYEDMAIGAKDVLASDKPEAAPKPEPPRIMMGNSTTVVALPPERQPMSTPPAEATKPAAPTTVVSFLMPDGFMPKEVKFVQVGPGGREQVYAATHKPNDLIKVNVPHIPGSKVHIYINNVPIEERSLD